MPQRSLLKLPRTASCPQAAEDRAPGTFPSPIMPISARPTSRPSIYPAEKLMAEKRTTTPALMTHVMTVGLTGAVESDRLARRLFFATPRSFGEADRRFILDTDGPDGAAACMRRGGPTEGLVSIHRGEDGPSLPLSSSPIATDSPTSLKDAGAAAAPGGPVCRRGESVLGSPRAAAAHDKRVERLARRAASWSA